MSRTVLPLFMFACTYVASLAPAQSTISVDYSIRGGSLHQTPDGSLLPSGTTVRLEAKPLQADDRFVGWFVGDARYPRWDVSTAMFELDFSTQQLEGRFVRDYLWGPVTLTIPVELIGGSDGTRFDPTAGTGQLHLPGESAQGVQVAAVGPALLTITADSEEASPILLTSSIEGTPDRRTRVAPAHPTPFYIPIPHGRHLVEITAGGAVNLSAPTLQSGLAVLPHPATGGMVIPKSSQLVHEPGTVQTFTAYPDEGWVFLEWYGDVSGTERTISGPAEEHLDIRARFAQRFETEKITFFAFGSEKWTELAPGIFESPVVADDALELTGVSLRFGHTGHASIQYQNVLGFSRISILLNGETPASGYSGVRIYDSERDELRYVHEATFEEFDPYQWRIIFAELDDDAELIVNNTPGGQVLGAPSTPEVELYSSWDLRAVPDEGYRFLRWEDSDSTQGETDVPERTVRALQSRRLTAVFQKRLAEGPIEADTSADHAWRWENGALVSPATLREGEVSIVRLPALTTSALRVDLGRSGELPRVGIYRLGGGTLTDPLGEGTHLLSFAPAAKGIQFKIYGGSDYAPIRLENLEPLHVVDLRASGGILELDPEQPIESKLLVPRGTEISHEFHPHQRYSWVGWSDDLAGLPAAGTFVVDGDLQATAQAELLIAEGIPIQETHGRSPPRFMEEVSGTFHDAFPGGAIVFPGPSAWFSFELEGPGILTFVAAAAEVKIRSEDWTLEQIHSLQEDGIPRALKVPIPPGHKEIIMELYWPLDDAPAIDPSLPPIPLQPDNHYLLLSPVDYRQGGAYVELSSVNRGGRLDPNEWRHVVFPGETIDITPVPDPGWRFDGWTGDWEGFPANVTGEITEDVKASARFLPEVEIAGAFLEFPGDSVSYDTASGKFSFGHPDDLDSDPVDLRWNVPASGTLTFRSDSFISLLQGSFTINGGIPIRFRDSAKANPLMIPLSAGDLLEIDFYPHSFANRDISIEFETGTTLFINGNLPFAWTDGEVDPKKERYLPSDLVILQTAETSQWGSSVAGTSASQPHFGNAISLEMEKSYQVSQLPSSPPSAWRRDDVDIATGTIWTAVEGNAVAGFPVFASSSDSAIGFIAPEPTVVEVFYRVDGGLENARVNDVPMTRSSGWQRLLLPVIPEDGYSIIDLNGFHDDSTRIFVAIGESETGYGSLIDHPLLEGMATRFPVAASVGEPLSLPFESTSILISMTWQSLIEDRFVSTAYEPKSGDNSAIRASFTESTEIGDNVAIVLPPHSPWNVRFGDAGKPALWWQPINQNATDPWDFEIILTGPSVFKFSGAGDYDWWSEYVERHATGKGFALDGEILPLTVYDSWRKEFVVPIPEGQHILHYKIPESSEPLSALPPIQFIEMEVHAKFLITIATNRFGDIQLQPSSELYAPGEEIVVSAIPIAGAKLEAWSGLLEGREITQNLIVTNHGEIAAVFSLPRQRIFGLDWSVDADQYGITKAFGKFHSYDWSGRPATIATEIQGPLQIEMVLQGNFSDYEEGYVKLNEDILPMTNSTKSGNSRFLFEVPEGTHHLTLSNPYSIQLHKLVFRYPREISVFAEWIQASVGEEEYWSRYERTSEDSDFDYDGITNRAEQALGLDPGTPELFLELVIEYADESAEPTLILRHQWPEDDSLDLSAWEIRCTHDLQSWRPLMPEVSEIEAVSFDGASWRELKLIGTFDDWLPVEFGLFFMGGVE